MSLLLPPNIFFLTLWRENVLFSTLKYPFLTSTAPRCSLLPPLPSPVPSPHCSSPSTQLTVQHKQSFKCLQLKPKWCRLHFAAEPLLSMISCAADRRANSKTKIRPSYFKNECRPLAYIDLRWEGYSRGGRRSSSRTARWRSQRSKCFSVCLPAWQSFLTMLNFAVLNMPGALLRKRGELECPDF